MESTSSPQIGQLPSLVMGLPASVQDAVDRPQYYTNGDLYEASRELSIARRKKRLARGMTAAYRSLLVTQTVVEALDTLGESKWAHRLRQCASSFWTVGCPNGHGGTVVAAMTKRCGLQCCSVCSRLASARLVELLKREVARLPDVAGGYRWRFLTVSLAPRATFAEAWADICRIRPKVMDYLKRHNQGVMPDGLAAIEFGQQGHPHLHVLYRGGFIVRDYLSRKLVGWTGGEVIDLPESEWVPVGKPTKRGQRYRTWRAEGGDWYVDIREAKGIEAVAEVAKYLTDPFGGGADVRKEEDRKRIVTAGRNAAAIAVAGKGKHRIQGYGALRGVVGRALGKKRKDDAVEALAGKEAGLEAKPSRIGLCGCCGAQLVVVQRIDKEALHHFNREWKPPLPPA